MNQTELPISRTASFVRLLQVDAAVQDAAEYAACDLPDEIVVRGRGGTGSRPGFAWLEQRDVRPSVCL